MTKRLRIAVVMAVLLGMVLSVLGYFQFVTKTVYEESVSHLTEIFHQSDNMLRELDGSQHYEDENQRKDVARTSFLEEYGLMVLRIPNNAVNRNFRGVCEYIDYTIEQRMTEE